jgi:protein involved in polysaccharide export with SLBB domain
MKKVILLACLLIGSTLSFAQGGGLQQTDLRQIHIDDLSDDQIIAYYQKAQQSGITIDQALQLAASKGMPQAEITKLQQRLQALMASQKLTQGTGKSYSSGDSVNGTRRQADQFNSTQEEQFDKKIFGSELFSTSSLSFEPNLRIATPANYVLGPDDQLHIEVFGFSEADYKLTVNPEGAIYIPNAGPILVAGLTIEDATEKIKSKLASTIYKAIATGNTRVQVTLGNIKSIHVTIIGQAKKPGGYTVSSLANVFNALYLCGGPNSTGSYRNIELLRNNKLYKTIDLYKVLVNGTMEDNIRLQDQDIIHIPYYKTRVTLEGEIKHPGVFEALPGEPLQKLLDFAGGFTDSAYQSSVKITQLTDKEKRLEDVANSDFASYLPKGSDLIEVGKILNRYTNRVTIDGAVMRPGTFELTPGLTLKQLIQKADGVKQDAFLNRGLITRLKDDLTLEVVPFDVTGILNSSQPDIALKREDKITISSIFDLKNKMTVMVEGEVRYPGTYEFEDSTNIKDIIFQAGGFTESATGKRIEVARRVTNGDANSTSTQIAQIVQVDAEKDLQFTASNFYLQPFDVVVIRNNPGYFKQKTITVEGEVLYPGPYVISSADEKLSSIVERAGGIKVTADPSAASLRRLNKIDDLTALKTEKINKLSSSVRDTTIADSLSKEAERPYDFIGINLQEVINKPGITNDLILEDGDILYIPKKNQAVKVRGEVLFPTQFAFEENKNLKYYIDKAGGFTSNAQRRRSFVLGANGNARRVKHFLFFKSYPEIYAGDEIFAPKKPERTGNFGETLGITSAVVGMASVVIALLNNLK